MEGLDTERGARYVVHIDVDGSGNWSLIFSFSD